MLWTVFTVAKEQKIAPGGGWRLSPPRPNGGDLLWGGDRPRKVQFSELRKPCDLDLRSSRGHTGAHMWSRSTHTPN